MVDLGQQRNDVRNKICMYSNLSCMHAHAVLPTIYMHIQALCPLLGVEMYDR